MVTLTLPATPGLRSSKFGLESNTQIFRSPLNGATQSLELPGARWRASFTLPPMRRAQAAAWLATLVRLRGSAGRFFAGDPDAKTPRGVATGAPLVNGASQTGASLITDGWSAYVTGILLSGDYVAFQNGAGNRELHMVVADADSDGTGNVTLVIEPPIRTSPADGAALIVNAATCEMMLVDDEQAAWDVDQIGVFGLSFSGIEAVL